MDSRLVTDARSPAPETFPFATGDGNNFLSDLPECKRDGVPESNTDGADEGRTFLTEASADYTGRLPQDEEEVTAGWLEWALLEGGRVPAGTRVLSVVTRSMNPTAKRCVVQRSTVVCGGAC